MFDDADNARFLHEIKALGKALRLPSAAAADPIPTNHPTTSLWKWKPLAVLSRIRGRRFDCRFSLHVHSITALPPPLDGAALRVHWRRPTDPSSAHTRPARAVRGTAIFDETLASTCSLSGARRSKARPFLVYATAVPDELDLGRHRVDLARLLPFSLEELEAGQSSGEWGTSFPLSGKAKGAVLNVSFGFSVADGRRSRKPDRSNLHSFGSFRDRNQLSRSWSCFVSPSAADDIVSSDRAIDSQSDLDISGTQSRSPEVKCCPPADPTAEDDCEEADFVVIDKGLELGQRSMKEISSCHMDDTDCCSLPGDSLMPELESAFGGMSVQQSDRSSCAEVGSDMDDLAESVASEFLCMLEMETPTGQLLEQFREEYLIGDDGNESNKREFEEDLDLSVIVHDVEMEHLKASQVMKSKLMAQTLVDAETEALMLEWGLNEDAFQGSLPENGGGFGSPIELPLEEPVDVPPLDEGLGPSAQTKNGGFL